MTTTVYRFEDLPDDALVARTRAIVGQSNQTLAALLAHLGEVEARGLHRQRACASLYTYCINELRMSEDAAFRRARAARIARAFPAALDRVAAGEIHLTGLLMIGPHLTDENHRDGGQRLSSLPCAQPARRRIRLRPRLHGREKAAARRIAREVAEARPGWPHANVHEARPREPLAAVGVHAKVLFAKRVELGARGFVRDAFDLHRALFVPTDDGVAVRVDGDAVRGGPVTELISCGESVRP